MWRVGARDLKAGTAVAPSRFERRAAVELRRSSGDGCRGGGCCVSRLFGALSEERVAHEPVHSGAALDAQLDRVREPAAAAAAAADAEQRHYGHTLFVASLEKSLGRLEVAHRGQAQALPDDDDGAARLNQALRLASLDAPPPHAATFSTAAPRGEDGEGVGGGGAGGEVFFRSSDGLRRVARERTQIAASRQ